MSAVQQKVSILDEHDIPILTGKMQDGLYKLNCSIKSTQDIAYGRCNTVAGTALKLLHRRLGHPGMRATRELRDSNAVLGLMHDKHACEEDYCEVCRNSKEHRANFAPSSHRCDRPL
jgi:hypothetical protein